MAMKPVVKTMKKAAESTGLRKMFLERGFSETENTLRFYRTTPGGVIQVVCFVPKASNEYVEVLILFYVPELFRPEFNSRQYGLDADLPVYVRRNLGERGVDFGTHFMPSRVATPQEAESVFMRISEKMEQCGFEFLDANICTREQFFSACSHEDREQFKERGMVDAILQGNDHPSFQ